VHLDRDDPDGLLNARTDPGGAAFGTMGAEAGSDLNWFLLLRQRVQDRAAGSSRYPWWVLWTLLAGLFALNFTFTVFIVALPTVASQFHTSVTVLTWTMVGPLLAYGLAAPIFGKTGDIFGHRRLYLFGLSGAMVSAILTALSHNVDMLLFARALDGVQGAATGTASAALIFKVFTPQERVKAMGWWSLIGAGGPVIGVSLGSPIIAAFGWRALFWLQLALIVVAFSVVSFVLPRRRGFDEEEAQQKARARREFKEMDWVGSWALSLGVTMLMLALSVGPSIGFSSPWCLALFALTVTMMCAFIHRIRHAPNPAQLRDADGPSRGGELLLLRGVLPLPAPDGTGLRLLDSPRRGARHRAPAHVRRLLAHCRVRGDSNRRARERHSGGDLPDGIARALRVAGADDGRVGHRHRAGPLGSRDGRGDAVIELGDGQRGQGE
jgi:MFS family permease